MTTKGLIKIVAKGASVIVDCRKLSLLELHTMMASASGSGAKITLRHFKFSDDVLDTILGICPQQITLDLTDLKPQPD